MHFHPLDLLRVDIQAHPDINRGNIDALPDNSALIDSGLQEDRYYEDTGLLCGSVQDIICGVLV